jgi:integrase/recombinase XerD
LNGNMLPALIERAGNWKSTPRLVEQTGGNARFAWEELFSAELRNPHTRRAYLHAVRQFLDWCALHELELRQITPGWVGTYYDQLSVSIPTKKQHLAGLRCFFDRLVLRHAVAMNPASSVRGERYQLVEGRPRCQLRGHPGGSSFFRGRPRWRPRAG